MPHEREVTLVVILAFLLGAGLAIQFDSAGLMFGIGGAAITLAVIWWAFGERIEKRFRKPNNST